MTAFFKSSALRPHAAQSLLVLAAILVLTPPARAATDISTQPLATLPNVSAAPNLLFILDNSGSMASAYMPDDMNSTSTFGYYSAQCNGTAYDPSHVYLPPVDYTNTPYTAPTYPTAYTDGYKISSGTHDASSDYYYLYSASTPQKRMGWTYPLNNGANVDTSTTFYGECNTSKSSSSYSSTWTSKSASSGPGYGAFTQVAVSGLGTVAQQNFINWYSYYRTRTLMMRTAVGLAVNQLGSTYNVGFTTISNYSAAPSATFLDTKSFSDSVGGTQSATSQKGTFYTDLYAATGNSNTPLRGALSKAGQYYAKKAYGQTYDPMQYACQRNYALLSTDGYWNTGTERSSANGSSAPYYAAYRLNDTTAIGNQDASEINPMKDSSFTTTTTTATYSTASNGATRVETTTQTVTIPWTRSALTTSSSNSGSTKSPKYVITTQPQTYSESQTQTCTQNQQAQASYVETSVVVDTGTPTITDSVVSYTSWVNTGTASCTTNTDSGAGAAGSAWANKGSATTKTSSTTAGDGHTVTYSPSASGTKGTSAAVVNTTSDGSPSITGAYTKGTPNVGTPVTTGAASDTLADIAEYYYATDLRNTSLNNCTSTSSGISRDVCQDDVPQDTSSGDTEQFQHMNTFTLGLGVSGTLPFDSTVTPKSGTKLNWPTPTNSTDGGDATNVDDLWHAALNGRGAYFPVLSASDLSAAITSIVGKVTAIAGSGSAASTSSLQLVSGANNRVYKASYTTVEWTGDVQAYTLDAATAAIGATPQWSAQTLLDSKPLTSRKVYFNKAGTLTTFSYASLPAGQQAYFSGFCSKSPAPTQCTSLGIVATDKTAANNGTNLVSYLAGARTYEAAVATDTPPTTLPLYRARTHLLGDIVDGAPVYVGKPPFSYSDLGYADFVTNQTSRAPAIYAAANDGMLHAFSAATDTTGGTELWAFVPTVVMPNLYKLADTGYSSSHQYFVDGAPVMGDVYINNGWKTILVGGFNDGGQGYYALDITDPANPAMLWEFTDTNLGYSYGNPVITKRHDGTWVVVFASGYNNTTGSADGNGHLFVVNAATGTRLLDLPTGSGASAAGSKTTPSGLAKINAWIDDATNNTSLRFYGGDLLGNVWRFDTDGLLTPLPSPTPSALLLASLKDINSLAQPITTQPQTVAVGLTNRPVVVVATGRYLAQADTTNTDKQSIYAIADNLDTTSWGDPRNGTKKADFVVQTLTVSGTTATITNLPVDFTSANVGGWYVDLPNTGERVFTDMALQLNTLVVSTGIPTNDACTAGGKSWLYFLNVSNGGIVTTNVVAGSQYSSEALVVGTNWVKDTSGNIHVIVQDSKGNIGTTTPPVNGSGNPNPIHRTSWRELTN